MSTSLYQLWLADGSFLSVQHKTRREMDEKYVHHPDFKACPCYGQLSTRRLFQRPTYNCWRGVPRTKNLMKDQFSAQTLFLTCNSQRISASKNIAVASPVITGLHAHEGPPNNIFQCTKDILFTMSTVCPFDVGQNWQELCNFPPNLKTYDLSRATKLWN